MSRSRRRFRYAMFRVGYVAWRAVYVEATLWHVAVAVGIALLVAIALVTWGATWGLPYATYFLPVTLAAGYGIVLVAVRFARAWGTFPEMRKEMRRRGLAELRYVGYARRRFARGTFWRVSVPFYATLAAGGAFTAWMFPGGRSLGEVISVLIFSAASVLLYRKLTRWNERFRPNESEHSCPRCGYDMAGSPQRCPECGMRTLRPATAEEIEDDLINDG